MSSAMFLDTRIQVRLVSREDLAEALRAAPDAVLLAEEGIGLPHGRAGEHFAPLAAGAHPVACACCGARGAAAIALDRLFLARAKGALPLFRTVLAVTSSADGEQGVRQALASDPVVPMRYRVA